MTNRVSDTEKLVGTCGAVVSGLVGSLDARAQQKHAKGEITLGIPFAMFGSMIGWWASHFILFTLATAAFLGIVGSIISGVVNCRRARNR